MLRRSSACENCGYQFADFFCVPTSARSQNPFARFRHSRNQVAQPAWQVAQVNKGDQRPTTFRFSDLMVKFDGLDQIGRNLPRFSKDKRRNCLHPALWRSTLEHHPLFETSFRKSVSPALSIGP
jgi:hypothetical protein